MGLNEYRRKRRFDETPEPRGDSAGAAPDALPRFVVQEHHATRVHWDLRLEMEGVLRSWAVPKGPSLDPADKRLAVLVEDHPLEYGEFEGIIPEGNYGAGSVLLWDRGTYLCREGDPVEAFKAGKMTLDLFGQKLRGEFHFVRTKRNEGRDWLLFKGKDEYAASGYVPTGTRSVKTGRLIEEVASDAGARWLPAAAPEPAAPPPPARRGRKTRGEPASDDGGADPFPDPFPPMLAESAEHPFSRAGWLFEVKWDGVRALAYVRRRGALQEITLSSRTLHRLNSQFPEVVGALGMLDLKDVVLDGEIIAPDENGRSSFADLQKRLHLSAPSDVADAVHRIPVAYAVFDCLYLNGRDLRGAPLAERRRALEGIPLPPGIIRTDVVAEDGRALFDAALQHGLEGIVAKQASSPYRSGVRSPAWKKIKVRRSLDAVVGGFTRGKGQRSHTFGALVLGQFDPETGALVHVGQVGGGLSDAVVRALRKRLDALVTETSPFAKPPQTLAPATWVRPEVVVGVSYAERTPDRVLRFPLFEEVRDDLRAKDVLLTEDGDARAAAAEASEDGDAAAAQAPAEAREDLPAEGREEAPRTRSRGGAAAPPGLAFTNLDKVFFPELGLTKGEVIDYYRRIAPHLTPHLRDRPLTLRRFPNGIHGDDFFQKDVTDAPPFARRLEVWSDQGKRDIELVVGADDATLLWLAQLGCIEMHAWFSRVAPVPGRGPSRPTVEFAGSEAAIEASALNYPDYVAFDIDPFLYPPGTGPTRRHGELDPDYSRRGFDAAREVALWVGDVLGSLGLRAFLKTSGKTGLHVFVPIARQYTYAETHAFAKTLAAWLVDGHPDRVTTAWAVTDRVGKVFVDYNQNVRGKTLASVYSLRPVPQATVSVPVTWDELRAGFDPLQWTIFTVFDRLAAVGDLWADILGAAQRLEVGPPDVRGAEEGPRGPSGTEDALPVASGDEESRRPERNKGRGRGPGRPRRER